MKKNIIFIAISATLFLAATMTNFWAMSIGSSATVPGFILSLLFVCGLVVFPLLSKGEKGFIKLELGFMVLISIVSIFGVLKSNNVITSDLSIPFIVGLLTSFYGLTYVVTVNILHVMMVAFALLSTAVLSYFLYRKENQL